MNEAISAELLEECIEMAVEDGVTSESSSASFLRYIKDLLPPEVMAVLEDIHGDTLFLEEIWKERFIPHIEDSDSSEDVIEDGCCLVCERKVRLTRHHVFPREMHRHLIKKGHNAADLNVTIAICRMCHSTIHRFWTNEELAREFYSLELLLANAKFYKYAKWASSQRQ